MTTCSKMQGGRWLLTIAAGIVLLAFSGTVCALLILRRETLAQEAALLSLAGSLLGTAGMIVQSYFGRQDRQPPAAHGPARPAPPVDVTPAH